MRGLLCVATYLVAPTWMPIYTRPKGSCHFLLFWKKFMPSPFRCVALCLSFLFDVEVIMLLHEMCYYFSDLVCALPLWAPICNASPICCVLHISTCYESKHWMTIQKQKKNCWNTWDFLNYECSQYVKGNESPYLIKFTPKGFTQHKNHVILGKNLMIPNKYPLDIHKVSWEKKDNIFYKMQCP